MSNKFFSGALTPKNGCVLVVMAGGSGTRFWPMSRTNFPKQFLPLGQTEDALIEESVKRFEPLVGKNATLVITAKSQAELVANAVPDAAILSEPVARNTAPCLALAAHYLLKEIGDIPMICIPADHVIEGQKELLLVFKKAFELSKQNQVLITLGIKPTHPETGYGYIKRGRPFQTETGQATGAFSVDQFVEKPDFETAKTYIESGDFFWNSGMFVWRPSVLISALETYLPDISRIASQCVDLIRAGEVEESKILSLYEEMQSVSIDVGVMEEAENAVVFPSHSFKWSDVGSWTSWSETVLERLGDNHENVILGDVLTLNSERCTVVNIESKGFDLKGFESQGLKKEETKSQKAGKLVAVVGMEDIIVVNLSDSILVCKKSDSQKVKQIVEMLSKNGRNSLI